MGCNNAFRDYLVKCVTSIDVFAQLAPLATYKWVIADKHNRQFSGDFTTDAAGMWEIDVADLPEGLLTEHSGSFSLTVQDGNCRPSVFKIAQEYDRIEFEILAGSYEKNQIGCDFECQGAAGALSTIVNYTGVTEKVISYTAEMLANYGAVPLIQVYALVAGETDVYEIIAAPITHVYVAGVLTTITVGNLSGLTGYIIIN